MLTVELQICLAHPTSLTWELRCPLICDIIFHWLINRQCSSQIRQCRCHMLTVNFQISLLRLNWMLHCMLINQWNSMLQISGKYSSHVRLHGYAIWSGVTLYEYCILLGALRDLTEVHYLVIFSMCILINIAISSKQHNTPIACKFLSHYLDLIRFALASLH